MPYKLRFSATAFNDLRNLSAFRLFIREHLQKLAASPTKHSRPSTPPKHLPDYQISEFLCQQAGEWHVLTVFFRYGADEQTLWIHFMGHVNYGPRRPEFWPEE